MLPKVASGQSVTFDGGNHTGSDFWSLSGPAAIVALVAGSLNVFAFAPFGWWPLQIVCVAVLFSMVSRSSVKRSAVLGTIYSTSWTCAGVYWLYISLHTIGGMPAWMTIISIGLLAAGLGLIVGLAMAGARWWQQQIDANNFTLLLMILPACWALSEWTRGWIFTGFPWLSTGYAHTMSPLAGYAPLIGVYGVGWIAALVAGSLGMLTIARASSRRSTLRTKLGLVTFAALLFLGGHALRGIEWTRPQGKPIIVRLLQGNIAQEMKFDQATLGSTLGFYSAMIMRTPADLIVIPETAIPITRQQLPSDYLPRLINFARDSNSHLALGMPISDDPSSYTNGLLLLDPSMSDPGSATYRYDKHHLVPFGEFIPTGFRWFVSFLNIPLGDQTRGAALQPPFRVNDQWILPNICYEDLFGEEIAAQFRARLVKPATMPTMMLNISNIAWFGNSIAVPQHLQISQMRTLETGRPMLRATNTGATAVINPHGQVLTELPPSTRGELSTSVQGYGGMTVFLRFGNDSIVLIALIMLTIPWIVLRLRRGSRAV